MDKKFILGVCIIVSLFIFASCLDDDEKEYTVDAYISTQLVDGDTLYALDCYIYSYNAPISSAVMKDPGKTYSVDLSGLGSAGFYFEHATSFDSYSTTKPASGEYLFTMNFTDGTSETEYDEVSNTLIMPTYIEEIVPDSDNHTLTVTWAEKSDADYYNILLFRSDTIVYASGLINNVYKAAVIYPNTNYWNSGYSPVAGDTIEVMISCIVGGSDNRRYYKSQSISRSQKVSAVWP